MGQCEERVRGEGVWRAALVRGAAQGLEGCVGVVEVCVKVGVC